MRNGRMKKEFILQSELDKFPNKDKSWKLDECDIEDKIKELRREIYFLKHCREKQPYLIVFRARDCGQVETNKDALELRCHIIKGFCYRPPHYLCADYWSPITKKESEYVLAKYNLHEIYVEAIERTLKENEGK